MYNDYFTKLNFIEESYLEKIAEENRIKLLNYVKSNLELIKLIKLNLFSQYDLESLNFDIEIINLFFDTNNLLIIFKSDYATEQKIKNEFRKKEASCDEDALLNFNKLKLNRHFLIPVDFVVKMRSFDMYKDYLINNFKQSLISQIIFYLKKDEWNYDGTLISYYNIYLKNIKNMDFDSKLEIINNILNK